MTFLDAVDEFDLRTPLTVREEGLREGPATSSGDLVVHARARNEYRPRTWLIDIPQAETVAWQRALSLHEVSGYGTLPLRWTPPKEATEINVFIDFPDGFQTTRVRARAHTVRVRLVEAR